MLADLRHLARAAAYYLSGRAVYALSTFNELHSISIESPDVTLSEARDVAAHALADFLGGGEGRRLAESTLVSVLVGLQAIDKAGANIQGWDAIAHSLKSQPSLFRLRAEASRFCSNHWNQIVRLTNAVLELRTVSTGQLAWLCDSRQRAAA